MEKMIQEIEAKLGYTFQDKALLWLSLVHRSYANEHKGLREHNERLEFLGDAVINLIVAEYLYREHPKMAEGVLSHLRSKVVDSASCNFFAAKLGIDRYLLLGKGEQLNQGKGRESIIADFFEAVVGAIFLDGGFEAAQKFMVDNFTKEIEFVPSSAEKNFKAQLQDWAQKTVKEAPLYRLFEESGPEHRKEFIVEVLVQGKVVGKGQGLSKKEAQQNAAKNALESWDEK